ncbi:MAG: PEGA domain-containing protein [Myxococcaceae bacterium]|nr:PEGA domain-containing protein [Myxococcaceae bacterium]
MTLKTLAVFTLVFMPLGALAQDELGLDFSEAKTPAEFRPAIAFVGVTPEQAEEPLAVRAKLIEAELLKSLNESERFGTVKAPVDVAGVSTTARKCHDFACLEALAEKLGVHRIVYCTLAKAGPGTVLSINGFDPTLPAVLPATVESGEKAEKAAMGGFAGIAGKSQAQRDKEFLAKVRGPFAEMLKHIATPLGKMAVDVIEQNAVTTWKNRELGTGSFEKALPVGSYEITVRTDGYEEFATTVTIEPLKKAEVKVTLVAKSIERPPEPVVATEPETPLYQRPGVYVALAGAVLVGVGLAMGAMAKSTENRAVDGDLDGRIDITRAQANGARTQALLANVLVPLGACVFAAGALWAFVVPLVFNKSVAPKAPTGPGSPGDPAEGSGFGAAAMFGGSF